MKKLISMFLTLVFVGFVSLAFAQQPQEKDVGEACDLAPATVVEGLNSEDDEIDEVVIDPNLTQIPGSGHVAFSLEQQASANEMNFEPTDEGRYLSGTPVQQIGPADWKHATAPAVVAFMHKNGAPGCSGALIGPYTVLTAAHCVMKWETGKYINLKQQVVYPGGVRGGFGAVEIDRVAFLPQKYTQTRTQACRKQYDYAIVVLKKPVGNQAGFFGISDPFLNMGKEIAVVGFPGVKDHNKTWWSPGKVVWNSYQSDYFYHNADTLPGSSGAPIFLLGEYDHIVALNTAHPNNNKNYNIATRPSHGGLISVVNKYRNETPRAFSNRSGRSGRTRNHYRSGKKGHYRKTAYDPQEKQTEVIQQVSLELNKK